MTAFSYLLKRALYRLGQFFVHWYVHSYFIIGGWAINTLEKLDRVFGLKITWRYFGQPLFKDFTYIGYFLGFIFRGFRITISLVIYTFVVGMFIFLYIIWALIPIYLMLGF